MRLRQALPVPCLSPASQRPQVQAAPPSHAQLACDSVVCLPPVQESDIISPDTKADSELVSRSTRLVPSSSKYRVKLAVYHDKETHLNFIKIL